MINIDRAATLPVLAWIATVHRDGEVTARVGDWIDVGDDFLVEGAWAESFEEAGFASSYSFTGSGLRVGADHVLVSTPCNTTEAVYSVELDGSVYLSNSIAGVLVESGSELKRSYLDYEADAMSISRGLERYEKSRPLAGGRSLGVHYYCNIVVRDGHVSRLSKSPAPSMSTYDDYRAFLSRQVGGVLSNAADVKRRKHFVPIVFCSSGYDSTACAALGKEFGCDEGVAFSSRRSGSFDSGKPVLEALGYGSIHEKYESEFMETTDAHLMCGTGELGTSAFFLACAPELAGKVLLSGIHGDKMWDRNYRESDGTIIRSEYPDTSKTEFRLHVGYLNFPPAFLTATSQHDMHRIGNSAEMAPWWMGNSYDRPVPRRIAEDAGVPRELFGRKSGGDAGSSFRFGTFRYLARTMPSASVDRFGEYLRRTSRRVPLVHWMSRAAVYSVFVLATLMSIKGHGWMRRLLFLDDWPSRFRCSPFAPSRLFDWAVDELSATSYRKL